MTDRQAILSARLRAVRGQCPQSTAPAPVPSPQPPFSGRKEYLRLDELAAELAVHTRTVRKWEQLGLRICRIGRIAVVRRSDLDEFLLRHGGTGLQRDGG